MICLKMKGRADFTERQGLPAKRPPKTATDGRNSGLQRGVSNDLECYCCARGIPFRKASAGDALSLWRSARGDFRARLRGGKLHPLGRSPRRGKRRGRPLSPAAPGLVPCRRSNDSNELGCDTDYPSRERRLTRPEFANAHSAGAAGGRGSPHLARRGFALVSLSSLEGAMNWSRGIDRARRITSLYSVPKLSTD